MKCPVCNKKFVRKNRNRKYCSDKCKQYNWDKNNHRKKVCPSCQKEFKHNYTKNPKYCSVQCKKEGRVKIYVKRIKLGQIKPKPIFKKTCPVCNVKYKTKNKNRKYCSRECIYKDPVLNKIHSKNMKKTNEKYKDQIIERMINNNPSKDPKVIEKGKNTKRIKGTLHIWSGERGRNGNITESHLLLASALGWKMEVAIPLAPDIPKGQKGKHLKELGFPTCYKVDIGNKKLKLAVEIDGKGHQWIKAKKKDKKKTKKLNQLGWKVLRFTNQEIMMDLSKVLLEIKKEIKDL